MADKEDAALAAAKQYMKVEGSEEDGIIAALLSASQIYLSNAGIEKPVQENSLYNLALWSLTLYYYDHRDDVGNESGLPNGLRFIINQLKLSTPEGCSGI